MTNTTNTTISFDFDDGAGPVPAHQHANGGLMNTLGQHGAHFVQVGAAGRGRSRE